MNYWILEYLGVVGVSIILAGIIIPQILLIAFRKKLFDVVDERKIHTGVVPRLGGIAFLPSLSFSLCLMVGLGLRMDPEYMIPEIINSLTQCSFLICAFTLIYLCGLADDLVGVRYRGKFIIQGVVGSLIIISGLWLRDLYGFMWLDSLPDWLGWAVTLLVIVYVVNAINLIDGIDGLASGLSAVALLWYSLVFYLNGEFLYLLVSGATLGTLVPFFYYNVFGKAKDHTKIFMGDTGSLTIGLMLVFLALVIVQIPIEDRARGANLFVLATAPLLVPCFDVARVFFHRLKKGRSPFEADKSHLHHKFLALGFKQWQALIIILALDMAFVAINVQLCQYTSVMLVMILDLVVWIAFNMVMTKMIRKREQKLSQVLYD